MLALENLIPLAEAARRLGLNYRSLRMWYARGLRGGRVRLTPTKIGDRVFVTEEALTDFQRRLNACPRQNARRTATERRTAQRRAEGDMEARRKRRQAAG